MKERFWDNLRQNRRLIEAATGQATPHFCYPNGWYRSEVRAWLEEAGVKSATTCDPGLVTPRSKPMYLPRMTDSCCASSERFEAWLHGIGVVGPALKLRLTGNAASPSQSPQTLAARCQAARDESCAPLRS